jgi:hypothetical protein
MKVRASYLHGFCGKASPRLMGRRIGPFNTDERAFCEEISDRLLDHFSTSSLVKKIIWRKPRMIRYITPDGHIFTLSNVCVPDTVDPRPCR